MIGEDPSESEDWQRLQAVRREHEDELLSLPNVVGLGIGLRKRRGRPTGELALVVIVSRKVPSAELAPEERIPSEIEGVLIDVQEMGEIRPQAEAGA